MKRVLALCNVLVATSVIGCATDDIDTSEEDAIADAAAPGKADSAFPLGFYSSFEIDHEKNEPLHAVFHDDGSMDFSKFVDEGYESRYYTGDFKVYKYRGRDRLRLTDTNGRVVFRGDWSLDDDGDLTFGGETWLQSTPDPSNLANCIAMRVADTNIFEEGFTEYEYPDFSVERTGTKINLGMGAGSIDSTEAQITVDEGATELVVKAQLDADERLEVRIPNAAPRRGVIEYAEEAGAPLHLMANIVCR